LTLLLPFSHGPLTLAQFGLALVIGVVASTGQWLAVLAYRHAGAAVLAPLSYGQLIWSSWFGFLVFATVPDRWTLVGAVFIIGSGLYTVQRERLRLRADRLRVAKA
jgi:drug/metabolite transporter (DMT)-like permease